MKNIIYLSLLILSIFLSSNMFSQDVQVPNGGFENWNSNILFYNPTGFYTSNNDASNLSFINVSKSTDKYQGTYAVKIETKGTIDFINPGSIVSGEPNPILGDDPYIGGFPFSYIPDSITGYFKYNLTGNDSAIIFVIFKNNGQYINTNYDVFKIYGIQETYKKLSFKISNLSETPDSVIIGIMSSNPNGASNNPGNWIIADNISLVSGTSSSLIPNGDFENWTPATREDVENWDNLSTYIPINTQSYCSKSSDKNNGSFAVNISTTELEINVNFKPVSYITTGEFILDNLKAAKTIAKGGFKVTSNPDSLSFYYKYDNINNENDRALIQVSFIKYGLDFGKTQVTLEPTDIYQKVSFKVNIGNALNPPGTIADTANIILSSSDYFYPDNIGIGNSLIVDDIKFVYKPTAYKISGTVTYDNASASPLTNNIRIYLKNTENKKFVDSVFTDDKGNYQFNNVVSGTYSLESKTTKRWRQCKPSDALIVNRTYIGLNVVKSDLRKKAGDVNNNTKLQPSDALIINRRYINIIRSFIIPDWIFENPTVIVIDADKIVNFKGICTGDIGGLYTPPAK